MSTSGGYHEYIGECPVHQGDIMSTLGDVQYITAFDIIKGFYELATPHECTQDISPNVLMVYPRCTEHTFYRVGN